MARGNWVHGTIHSVKKMIKLTLTYFMPFLNYFNYIATFVTTYVIVLHKYNIKYISNQLLYILVNMWVFTNITKYDTC